MDEIRYDKTFYCFSYSYTKIFWYDIDAAQ